MWKYVLFSVLILTSPVFALDPIQMIADIVSRDRLPRQMNLVDLTELDVINPQPLISPEGDFNGDGIPDKAIAGTYDLFEGKRRFFLLVATKLPDQRKIQKLYFKEFAMPIFLFYPGTTGQGDPGDQAFSISQCYQCDKGWDFYWNKDRKTFRRRPWSQKIKRISVPQPVPSVDVPQEQVDKALKIVGILPDIQSFVEEVQGRGSNLGTRVEYKNPKKRKNIFRILIFEKKNGEEIIYDKLLVNTDKGKILKRQKKIKKKPKAANKSR